MAKGKKTSLKKALTKQQTREYEAAQRLAYEKRQKKATKQKNLAGSTKGKNKSKNAGTHGSSHRPSFQPYRNGQRVLLVGEGNFSFALAFATRFPASAKVSIATSYDSENEAQRKYSDVLDNVSKLRELGMTVLFQVDGQKLDKTKALKKCATQESLRFDHVAFYFPHVGLGEKDEERNVKLNQILLLRFLRSVRPFLKEKMSVPQLAAGDRLDEDANDDDDELGSDPESVEGDDKPIHPAATSTGSVLITLFTSKPYNLWALGALAKTPSVAAALLPFPESRDAQPKYKIERSFQFSPKEWPGYEHRRTIGERKGDESLVDRTHTDARTWQLTPSS